MTSDLALPTYPPAQAALRLDAVGHRGPAARQLPEPCARSPHIPHTVPTTLKGLGGRWHRLLPTACACGPAAAAAVTATRRTDTGAGAGPAGDTAPTGYHEPHFCG